MWLLKLLSGVFDLFTTVDTIKDIKENGWNWRSFFLGNGVYYSSLRFSSVIDQWASGPRCFGYCRCNNRRVCAFDPPHIDKR